MSAIRIPRPGCYVAVRDGISFERGLSGNRMLIIVRQRDKLLAQAITDFLVSISNDNFLCQISEVPSMFVYLHNGRHDDTKRLARIIARATLFLSVPA